MRINNYFKTLSLVALMGVATATATAATDGSKQYTGTLDITVGGDVTSSTSTITITPNNDAAGSYTFLLPNFAFGTMTLGDIKLTSVSASLDATGTVKTYTSAKETLSFYGGAMNVDVELSGTTDALGNATFNIPVNVAGQDIPVAFKATGAGKSYDGTITVNMGNIVTQPATLYITPNGDESYSILLPNFSLGESMQFGNIELTNVAAATADGVTTYTGAQTLLLMNGYMSADVSLSGTLAASGTINIDIMVSTGGNTIPVNFTNSTGSPAGIAEIGTADLNAPAEYYTPAGIRVANPAAGHVYIVRQGSKVSKMLVK